MLHIEPKLVKLERCEPRANAPTFEWAEGDLIRSPRAVIYRSMKEMTFNGAYGDPSRASAEKGKQISEVVSEAISRIVTDLAKDEFK